MTILYAWAIGAALVFLALAIEELRGAATSLDEREGRWVWLIITVLAAGWPLWLLAAILVGLAVLAQSARALALRLVGRFARRSGA